MKAKLIYNLPEEEQQFTIASNSGNTLDAVTDFHEWMRNRLKHSTLTKEGGKELEYVLNKFLEFMNDYNVKHLLDY